MPQISFVLPYYAADPMVQIYWVGTINGVPTDKPLTPDNGRATWRLLLDLDETTSVELIYHYQIEREGLLQRVRPILFAFLSMARARRRCTIIGWRRRLGIAIQKLL